jgi:glycyl-tRNA synthetase beta chain
LLARAADPFGGVGDAAAPLYSFMSDRLAFLLEQRGYDVRNVRAVLHGGIERTSPLEARLKLEALAQMSGSEALLGVATLLKRVKNITKGVGAVDGWPGLQARLIEPAEKVLWSQVDSRAPGIRDAAAKGDYREAFAGIAALQPAVAKFFDDVLVMADDEGLRHARLTLVAALRDLILGIADISEIVNET